MRDWTRTSVISCMSKCEDYFKENLRDYTGERQRGIPREPPGHRVASRSKRLLQDM